MMIAPANETMAIVYGAWLEDAFGLKVAALGLASAVIGVAELGGEGLVAAVVDRVGKRRAFILGVLGNALMALLLPAAGFSVGGALAGLFLFFLTFEFAGEPCASDDGACPRRACDADGRERRGVLGGANARRVAGAGAVFVWVGGEWRRGGHTECRGGDHVRAARAAGVTLIPLRGLGAKAVMNVTCRRPAHPSQ